jgi:hypothetical protein
MGEQFVLDRTSAATSPYEVDADAPASGAGISPSDMDYQKDFSDAEKARLMRAVLLASPEEVKTTSGKHDFEKSLLRLRADGFRLIDMQWLEVALTTVWYRKSVSLLGFAKSEVVIALDWTMMDDRGNETTTLRRWRLP